MDRKIQITIDLTILVALAALTRWAISEDHVGYAVSFSLALYLWFIVCWLDWTKEDP